MANPTARIKIDDLRRAANLLLDHASISHGDYLDLKNEYFWSIPVDEGFDMTNQPQDLTIGSIQESWQHLADMLNDNSKVVGYGLVWLAEVLRAIGDETP